MASTSISIDTTKSTPSVQATDFFWLYKIGGAAALIIAVLIPIHAWIFIANPPPDNILDFFRLFQKNWLIGLLDLDLLMILDQVLMIPIILALYVALKRTSESFMAIGAALAFVATTAYFASREATFGLLSLSSQYAAANTDAQRAMFLAAGQALFTTYNGTAFQLSYNLGQVAGIIISFVMLRSKLFSPVAAYAGIIGNLVGFGLYVPAVGTYISLFSVIGLWIWYILVGRSLLKMK
jgi:opacity protein-like surface antigen